MPKQQTNQQQVKATARQTGWNYTTNPGGSNTANVAVTFPTPFAAAPKVIGCPTGYKVGTVPVVISDFNGVYSGNVLPSLYILNISTTGFTAYINAAAGSFGASYNGFSWMAEA